MKKIFKVKNYFKISLLILISSFSVIVYAQSLNLTGTTLAQQNNPLLGTLSVLSLNTAQSMPEIPVQNNNILSSLLPPLDPSQNIILPPAQPRFLENTVVINPGAETLQAANNFIQNTTVRNLAPVVLSVTISPNPDCDDCGIAQVLIQMPNGTTRTYFVKASDNTSSTQFGNKALHAVTDPGRFSSCHNVSVYCTTNCQNVLNNWEHNDGVRYVPPAGGYNTNTSLDTPIILDAVPLVTTPPPVSSAVNGPILLDANIFPNIVNDGQKCNISYIISNARTCSIKIGDTYNEQLFTLNDGSQKSGNLDVDPGTYTIECSNDDTNNTKILSCIGNPNSIED